MKQNGEITPEMIEAGRLALANVCVFNWYDRDMIVTEVFREMLKASGGNTKASASTPEQAMKVAHEVYHPDPVATAEAMRDMLLSKE